jgi:hypothetical protein
MAELTFLDKAVYWVNLAYIASVSLTIITTVMIVVLSHQRSAERDARLKTFQLDSEQRVAAANLRASESNVVAAKAVAEAQSMSLTHEQLRKENLQLSVELERQKKLRLEIEERIAVQPPQPVVTRTSVQGGPRVLSPEQEQEFVSSLSPFGGTRVSLIELGDAEAGALARQITGLLQQAHWDVVVSRFGALVPPQHGVVCTHRPNDPTAAAVIKTLRSFNLTVYDRSGTTAEPFEIIVGLTP